MTVQIGLTWFLAILALVFFVVGIFTPDFPRWRWVPAGLAALTVAVMVSLIGKR